MELQKQFSYISQLIAEAKTRAYQAVNRELVTLYWHIGEYASEQVRAKAWGKSVVKELSSFIQQSEPNIVGFSSQNIWRMIQFYEAYKDDTKLSTLSREISWSHNVEIFSKNTKNSRLSKELI
jgi:predicted nuclease of restriction endonuclease-like (RecB) superfamily